MSNLLQYTTVHQTYIVQLLFGASTILELRLITPSVSCTVAMSHVDQACHSTQAWQSYEILRYKSVASTVFSDCKLNKYGSDFIKISFI